MTPLCPPALLLLALGQTAMPASDLAGYLRLLSTHAGSPGRIACRDLDMAASLKKQGISTDPRAPLAWAANAEQVKAFASEGKLVVCGDPALLPLGAALVITREGSRTSLLLHARHAQASGVPLSDAILKVARQV